MRTIFFAALLCFFLTSQNSIADSSVYDTLRARYMSLRNTDTKGLRIEEWRDLIDDLSDFIPTQTDKNEKEAASYFLGVASAKVFEVARDKSYYFRARKAFLHLSKEFRDGDRGDDALLALGDLLSSNGEKEIASIAYNRIIKDFPTSDVREIAKQRLRTSSPIKSEQEPTTVAVSSGTLPVVILDPGHGGEDFGAVGLGHLLEKDVALDIALLTKSEIEKNGAATPVLTRSNDSFVPLSDRTVRVNLSKAALLVSIHANASPGNDLRGIETYFLDVAASDDASKAVSDRENAAGVRSDGSSDIDLILTDLMRRAKHPQSKHLADVIQTSVLKTLETSRNTTRNLGVKKAPFYILAGVTIPSALIEVGFLDHQEEGIKLGDKSVRGLIAKGIANGIINFLSKNK